MQFTDYHEPLSLTDLTVAIADARRSWRRAQLPEADWNQFARSVREAVRDQQPLTAIINSVKSFVAALG